MNAFAQAVPSQFLIRSAEAKDACAISALLHEAFAEFEALYTPEAYRATVLTPSGILARMNEGPVWVAETGSAVIGTAGAMSSAVGVLIRGMAAAPSARGLGLGKRLLDHVERFAAQQGARVLTLHTTAFLHRAIRLYEGAGFEFTGETANPHGTELLRMTKVLTA